MDPEPRGNVARVRLQFVASVALFTAAHLWSYWYLTSPLFDYFGLGFDRSVPLWRWGVLLSMVVLPAIVFPAESLRPSVLFLLIQYLVVYIPAQLIIIHGNRPALPPEDQWLLSSVLFAALILLFVMWHFIGVPERMRTHMKWPSYTWMLLGLTVTFTLLVYRALGANAQLVGLADVYVVRGEASQALADQGDRLTMYLISWLNAVILPLLFVRGLERKSVLLAGGSVALYIYLFSLWGGKASLIGPLAIGGLWWLRRQWPERLPHAITIALALLLVAPAALPADGAFLNLVRDWAIGLFNHRVMSASALLVTQYYDFFQWHPHTGGAQITGLSWVLDYPFDFDIPRLVGNYYYGSNMTGNVNFWAQDGIESFGLPGVFIVTVVAAVVMRILDWSAQGLAPAVAIPALGYMLANFADTSLFSTILTGGMFLMMILLIIAPRDPAVS